MNVSRHCRGPRALSAALVLSAALPAPTSAQATRRVSLDSDGLQADSISGDAWISANGRYVAFESSADDLVPGDTNHTGDVFVRDLRSGATERVSVSSGGVQGNGISGWHGTTISADGRYVAFHSHATNLVAHDRNACSDVFVRDRQSGTTERISLGPGGIQGNGHSRFPSITPDGRYVAFSSSADDLVAGDTNATEDVFVRDRQNGTTERISVTSAGGQGDGISDHPSISADGRYVAFESIASDLVRGETNTHWAIYVRDRQLGTTERVSVSYNGTMPDDSCFPPSISADGRYVAFCSGADNLVPGDIYGFLDVFVRDRQLGTTERVSVSPGGLEGNLDSGWKGIAMSADGRFVAFQSYATNLVPGDTNHTGDVFVRDRLMGTTEIVSVGSGGAQANLNSESQFPSISNDGSRVAFDSDATTLVPGDTNGVADIFVRDRESTTLMSVCDPGVGGVLVCPCGNPPSGPGRGCNNSTRSGGASLSGSGGTFLSSDSLVFTTSGEVPTATSVLLQGTTSPASGIVYGQGVRCVGGILKRLFTKSAIGGSITAPDFEAGDPSVSTRSAAKGNPISAGQSRWYLVCYRDPIVLGGCPPGSTFNATQTGLVSWSP